MLNIILSPGIIIGAVIIVLGILIIVTGYVKAPSDRAFLLFQGIRKNQKF